MNRLLERTPKCPMLTPGKTQNVVPGPMVATLGTRPSTLQMRLCRLRMWLFGMTQLPMSRRLLSVARIMDRVGMPEYTCTPVSTPRFLTQLPVTCPPLDRTT